MKIIVDKYLSDYELIKRSWKERFFSLPWKPWVSFKKIYNPKIYKIDGAIICSPKTKVLIDDARLRSPSFHSAMSYADIHDFDK